MTDWRKIKLGDYINIKHGFAFKGEYITEIENGNILLTPGNFKIGGGFKADKFKYYTGEIPENYILKPDDLIISMTDLSKEGDTLGFPAKVPHTKEKIFLHNQRIGLVQFISNNLDKNFLYYLLCTKSYQKTIVNSASGSTVRHTSPTKITEYEFLLPSLPEQRAIAAVLSSFDDKIELLRSQNQSLEALAQALSKEWFVDFNFPNAQGKPYKKNGGKMVESELGEIPGEWKISHLKDIAEIKNGFAFKSEDYTSEGIPIVRTTNFTNTNSIELNDVVFLSEEKSQEYLSYNLEKFDFLLVMVGASIGKSVTVPLYILPALQNQNMWNFKPKKEIYRFYNILLLKSFVEEMKKSASGSAREFFRKDYFYSLPIILPDETILIKFQHLIKSIMEKVDNNISQIQNLSNIRNELLPKLMQNKIKVNF